MGTRINVIMDHGVDDFRDQSAVLARLETALPAALAVHDYWNVAAGSVADERRNHWVSDPIIMPYEEHYRSYTGPGSLFLKVGPYAARIRTGGRWRGFLSIPALHAVHLQAFHSIGQALGATQLAYFPDCDDVSEVLYEGGKYKDIVPILTRYFGPPQLSIDTIAPEIAEETDRTVPAVWYSEELSSRRTTWINGYFR